MGWSNINLSLLHSVDFSISTRELILRVFDSATAALDDEHKKYKDYFDKNIGKAYERDESEGGIMSSEMDWEEDMYRQRRQGVGALALDWLTFSLQEALNGAKKYLDSSHPPKASYAGKSWLFRTANEYQERFKIDFNKAPVSFDRIQEVVLARNAGVHRHVGRCQVDEGKRLGSSGLRRAKQPAKKTKIVIAFAHDLAPIVGQGLEILPTSRGILKRKSSTLAKVRAGGKFG